MDYYTQVEVVHEIIRTMMDANIELDEIYALNYVDFQGISDPDHVDARFDRHVDEKWEGPEMATAHVIVTTAQGSRVYFLLPEAWKQGLGQHIGMIKVEENQPRRALD